jgi:outer membrane lipoprotein-sorting protein
MRVVAPSEVRPMLQATEPQLVAAYNAEAASVKTINAAVRMTPVAGSAYSGVIQEYHEVGGFIMMSRPEMIRIIGQAPLVAKDIFDMVSDGRTFRIFVPSKNQFLVGSNTLDRAAKSPIENLRPQHILDGFFWPELPVGAPILFEQFDALPEHYYVLTLLRRVGADLEIDRKIWFDRANLRISRVQIYGPAGRLDADMTYSDWQPSGPSSPSGSAEVALFPCQVVIRRPQQDYQLTVAIAKLTLNTAIPADRFVLEQPAGSQLVRVGQDEPQGQPAGVSGGKQ